MTESTPDEYPSPYTLADDQDELDWSRHRFGSFADYTTDDDVVKTVPYDPNDES